MYTLAAAENQRSVAVPAFGSFYRRQLFDWIMDVLQRRVLNRFVVYRQSQGMYVF